MNKWKLAWLPAAVLAMIAQPASAQDEAPQGDWEWGAEVYFWAADLGGQTTSGDDIHMGIGDIIKDLKMGGMATIAGHNGRWGVFSDNIYLNLGDSADLTADIGGVPTPVTARVGLKGLISTTGAGLRVVDDGGTTIDLTGGIRYLWLKGSVDVTDGTMDVSEAVSGTEWNGVIGFRGRSDLSEKLYLTYYADVGTGESDLTWQALAALNYRLGGADLIAGYRYLEWDYDDFGPFDSLNLSGPFMGVKFKF